MADRSYKLRRLNAFRRSLPHVSASALSSILDEVVAEGIPELRSRKHIAAATYAAATAMTPYGTIDKVVPLISTTGEPIDMMVASPLALLWKSVKDCKSFSTMFMNRLAASPPSPEAPWRLVLYSDEVVPGNPLATDNRRKVWVVYFSFLELGPAVLCHEEAWFCVMAKRSHDVNQVSGGMSQVFKAIVKMFFGADIHNLATGGMHWTGHDGSSGRLFAHMGMFLQDGGAHKTVWHCKGDAGSKLCMLCRNLYTQKSQLVAEDGSHMLTCSLIHEADLDFATDDDIRGSVRRLAVRHATDSNVVFKQWSMVIGFRHEPNGMLMDPTLDNLVQPATHFCHDWMHAIFVHGVFNTMVFLVFEDLMNSVFRNIWDTMFSYIEAWVFPHRLHSTSLKDMFSKTRAKSSRKAKFLKCTASEGLSVYPILAFFIQTVVLRAGRCMHACHAFMAMSDMIDLLVATPLGVVTPDSLREAVKTMLAACVAAGWRDALHPKFHWLVHLPHQLAHFGVLPTCWVHERKHKMVKRYANDITNTVVFERSVTNEVTAHHLADLHVTQAFDLGVHLIRGKSAPRKMHAFLTAELGMPIVKCRTAVTARTSEHTTCHKGDVVILSKPDGFDIGMVWFHADVEGECISLVSVWTLVSKCKLSGSSEYGDDHEPMLVPTGDILATVVYSRLRPGLVRVLVPCHLRSVM
jgi:hypothetical protein